MHFNWTHLTLTSTESDNWGYSTARSSTTCSPAAVLSVRFSLDTTNRHNSLQHDRDKAPNFEGRLVKFDLSWPNGY